MDREQSKCLFLAEPYDFGSRSYNVLGAGVEWLLTKQEERRADGGDREIQSNVDSLRQTLSNAIAIRLYYMTTLTVVTPMKVQRCCSPVMKVNSLTCAAPCIHARMTDNELCN
jgi:hypothetical protein